MLGAFARRFPLSLAIRRLFLSPRARGCAWGRMSVVVLSWGPFSSFQRARHDCPGFLSLVFPVTLGEGSGLRLSSTCSTSQLRCRSARRNLSPGSRFDVCSTAELTTPRPTATRWLASAGPRLNESCPRPGHRGCPADETSGGTAPGVCRPACRRLACKVICCCALAHPLDPRAIIHA